MGIMLFMTGEIGNHKRFAPFTLNHCHSKQKIPSAMVITFHEILELFLIIYRTMAPYMFLNLL